MQKKRQKNVRRNNVRGKSDVWCMMFLDERWKVKRERRKEQKKGVPIDWHTLKWFDLLNN